MKNIIITFFAILFFWSCSEVQDWSDSKDSIPPGKITNPQIENLYGGVRITYKLPSDKDILGVKAICDFYVNGEKLEVFSSAFRDTIEIHGFPNTEQRIVSLICVDNSQNESEPVDVIIKPLTPPVELIKQSLKVIPTFGGIFLDWQNEMNSDISILISSADSTGKISLDESYFTNSTKDSRSFRGYDDSERKFQIEIRDRWGNKVELDTTLIPLFEQEILPKNEYGQAIWKGYGWDDDSWKWRGDLRSHNISPLIDGIPISYTGHWSSTYSYISYYDNSFPENQGVLPIYFTIDLGVEVTLSRFVYWMRGRNLGDPYLKDNHLYYQSGALKYVEVWGSRTPKQPSDFSSQDESLKYWTEWNEIGGTDAWKNDWHKLGEGAFLPPSGAIQPDDLTVDDIIFADNGFEIEIDPEMSNEPVRYIRLIMRLWNPLKVNATGKQIKLFGAYTNTN